MRRNYFSYNDDVSSSSRLKYPFLENALRGQDFLAARCQFQVTTTLSGEQCHAKKKGLTNFVVVIPKEGLAGTIVW